MYEFKIKNTSYTCPDSSFVTLAKVKLLDNKKDPSTVHDNVTAKAYLESLGFEVKYIPDPEELTEVPKVANWYNRQHRDLYDKLFYHKMDRPLTEEEEEFCKTMYHFEEFSCGLDG